MPGTGIGRRTRPGAGALRRLLAALLLGGLCAAGAQAQLREDAPDRYLVREGDTLWRIAGLFLDQPWRWPEVWDVNPQIDNPHLIYPGDTIYLSYVDGRPRLSLRRGRDVKLRPDMRVTPLERAIPVIPLDEIGAFLLRHRILEAEQLNASPYVVAGAQQHLIVANGDRVYARGSFPAGERVFGIYRAGAVYRDPLSSEIIGYEARDIGNARAMGDTGEPVVELEVTRITEEVRIGDRLLPEQERVLDATFQPRAPEALIDNGFMIAVDGGVTQIGTLDIVALNRGAADGLEIGHVLAIYQAGELVFDQVARENVRLPDVRAGLCMIFETSRHVSYALVLKANRPLKVMDKVKNP